MTIVDTCWGPREIDEKPYWHLVPPSGTYADIFKNNVRVGKGALLSVSAGIEAEPHLENAHTPYSLSRRDDKKEKVFEEVRQKSFPMCPSRLKTIYVFDDYALVERALKEWFSKEPKMVYECRIMTGSITHRADTTWLNCSSEQWVNCAYKYWSGEMSNDPFPEVRVHGVLYFPKWVEFTGDVIKA